jgi:predicted metalloprotease with PDZ domain
VLLPIKFKKYIFLLALLINGIAIGQTLNYDISITGNSCFSIKASFLGSNSGVTSLYLPKKASCKNTKDQIKDIKLENPNQELRIKNDAYSVAHVPGNEVVISYDFCPNKNQSYVYLSPQVSYFLNKRALVIPEEIDLSEVIYHFNQGKSIQKVKIRQIQDIIDSFAYFGAKKHVKLSKNNHLYVQDGILIDNNLVNAINKLLHIQQTLFKNAKYKPVSIYLLSNKGGDKIQGQNLDDIILVEVNKNDSQELIEVIAHELMHRVFGGLISLVSGRKYQWFFEGFTEYYAQKSLLQSGLINQDDFNENYKMVLVEHYSCHAHNVDNDNIARHYWHNDFIRRIAYLRGQILAQKLEDKLVAYTNSKYHLEDIISEIIHKSQNPEFIFDPKIISESFYRLTNHDQGAFIQQAWEQGIMHIKNLDKLNIKVPIYGFDALGSFLGKKIQGVERKSAAYDAGLRNGQKLLQIFTNKDNSIEVQIQIAKNKIEIIKFNPDLYHNPFITN